MTAWKRFCRNRLAMVGLALIVILAVSAALAPWLAPYDPARSLIEKRAKPGGKYWLGADEFGRDILAGDLRLAGGALVGVLSVIIALTGRLTWARFRVRRRLARCGDDARDRDPPGLSLSAAGPRHRRGHGDGCLEHDDRGRRVGHPDRDADGPDSVLALRETEYVGAAAPSARHAGPAPAPYPAERHPGLVVYARSSWRTRSCWRAALSFLGLGVQPPTASWGLMVSTGRDVLLVAPHVATVPGVAIMVAVLAFNLVGDGLRDALDPRMRGST
jgi:hypothetical protein